MSDEEFKDVTSELITKLHNVLKEYVDTPIEMECALSIMLAHAAQCFGIPDTVVILGVQSALQSLKEDSPSGALH